jgi:hypothetical protein
MEQSAAELLDAWQEAVLAAELAERLATIAAEQTKEATERALLSAELAELVEQAAEAAVLASEHAIAAATQATALAERLRGEGMDAAWRTVDKAVAAESDARAAYQRAEAKWRTDKPKSGS